MKEMKEKWPDIEESVDEDEIRKEKKKSSPTIMMTEEVQPPRFSSYLKNVWVATYMRCFIDNCRVEAKRRKMEPFLKIEEMKRGERDLIYELQRQRYATAPKMKNLSVSLKEDKLYHVKT